MLPLNDKQKLKSSYHLADGERLLSVLAVVVVSFTIDKALDFHDATFSLSPSLLKYNKVL